MSSWLPFLVILVCPLVMGLMMVGMRPSKRRSAAADQDRPEQKT